MFSEATRTQIGGKFSSEDLRLFNFKQALESAGIHVNYPAGEGIIDAPEGFALTDETERAVPFHKIELEFLRSIKETPVHIVFNIFKDKVGYIGESASIEIAYALAHNKPLVLLREPDFSATVPDEIREIIEKARDAIHIIDLDNKDPHELTEYINELISNPIDYQLTDEDKKVCMRYIIRLIREKKDDFKKMEQENA